MSAHSQHNRTARFFSGLILSLLISLAGMSNNSWANRADWGLVERFQTQLEQAETGNIKAMYEVGRMYERGRGTGKSFDAAANWYKKASEAGHYSAKARLGKMYIEGRGVTKNLNKAYKLLTTAAQNNVSSAQYQLAIMYEIGIGISENTSKALYWYKKAAALGHYQAERKAKKLSRASHAAFIAPVSRPTPKTKAAPKSAATNIIDRIAKGSWHRRKQPAGYLPSAISNCKKINSKTLVCISTEQERNTGSEIISFNTEATITASERKNFVIKYSNNVLEVELIKSDIPSGVEGEDSDDGEDGEDATDSTTAGQNAIHKGRQAKVHHLDCKLHNAKTISCLKDATRTLEFKS